MGKTAAELMAELAKNKEFQAKKKVRDLRFADLGKLISEDEKVLVQDLNRAGYSVDSVWDFVNSENTYLGAEPILVAHLKVRHHPKIMAGIARALAVTEFAGNEELWSLLVDLYKKTPSDSDIGEPEYRGAQAAIAIALESLATPQRSKSLKKLIANVPNGDGVHWLIKKMNEL